jgi:hypothetical protein
MMGLDGGGVWSNYMNKIIYTLLFIVIIYGTTEGAWSSDPNYRFPLQIPSVPSSCVLMIYGPLPLGIFGMQSEKSINDNWIPFLITRGIFIPKGGFAIFYRPARILIVATDKKNQELISNYVE